MLAPGTVLQDRYKIVRLLARGGMGAVYEARDQRLSSTVALKETFFAEEDMRRAFKREASLLAGLRHHALPKVIDHFIEGDGQFLVMEYIPGDDLGAQLLRQGIPFPLPDVLNWGDQLLAALDYLHSHQPPIIHRDIKPQNLKLTDRGDVILLDFGLAKGAGSTTPIALSIRGYTLNYASLEQIRGLGTNPRSDLYSLAATLYHLMTAVSPPDALSRVAALVSRQPDPLLPADQLNPPVPIAIARVLESAMAQDPEERPLNADRMRAALREAAAATSETETQILGSGQVTVRGMSPSSSSVATERNRATPETDGTAARSTAPDTAPVVVRESTAPASATTPHSLRQSRLRELIITRRPLVIAGGAVLAIVVVVVFVLIALSGSDSAAAMDASSASSDRSKPTPLAAKTILGGAGVEERFFSFVAKRGELTITLDALANGSTVSVELFDAQSNNLRFDGSSTNLSVGSNTHIEEVKARVLVEREQPLLMRIAVIYPKEMRAYRLKIDGDVELAGGWGGFSKAPEILSTYLAERDSPNVLLSNPLLSGGTSKDLYYRFNAGPGELRLTLNVVSNGGTVAVELFDSDAKELRFENSQNLSAQSSGHNEQESATIILGTKKQMLMRITNTYPNETRAFRLRLEGPVEAAEGDSVPDAVSEALARYFTDRDNPTALTSNELSGRGSARDLYYSFTAGPGELKLALEVTASGSAVTVELFDANANKLPSDIDRTSFPVNSSGDPVEEYARFDLPKEEQVIMRVSQSNPTELKSFRLKLYGDIKVEGSTKFEDAVEPVRSEKPKLRKPRSPKKN